MENSEDFNEWQHIEYPSSSSSSETSSPRVNQSSSTTVVELMNTEVVINKDNDNNYLHNFHADDQSSVEQDSENETTSPSEGAITMPQSLPPSDWRWRVANEGGELLKMRFQALRVWVASKVRNCGIYVGAFWSITCVTGAAAAAVVLVLVIYRRIQRRRWRRVTGQPSVEHLVDLLREKDEKISQLLLQIAQLNEVLSSRCNVPVLRIRN